MFCLLKKIVIVITTCDNQGNYSDSGSSSVSQDSIAGDNAIANAIWHNLERLIVGYHLKRVEKGLLPPLAQECLKALYQERMRNKLRLAEIDCKDLEQVTDVLFRGKRYLGETNRFLQ